MTNLRTSFDNELLAELRKCYAEWFIDSEGECTLGGAASELLRWDEFLPENEYDGGWDFTEPDNAFAAKVLRRIVALYS